MTKPAYHLAQINIGRILAPVDDPIMSEFMARLDEINALAERSPGFVWRFQTAEGNATAVRPYEDDRMLVNFSVWESLEQLQNYVYHSLHTEVMRKRKQWFSQMDKPYLALWWVTAGHTPTVEEAKARIDYLQQHGESEFAFTFKNSYPAPKE